jgi:hypothetical protein
MMRRLAVTARLPAWMQPDHPVLRYSLGRNQSVTSARTRYLRALVVVLWLLGSLVAGYLVASNVLREDPFQQPLSQMLMGILFWPVFLLQVVLQVGVMLMTMATIGEEKRRQTWDSLRATWLGPALALRARWSVAVFYRLRGILGLLLLVRLVLIGGILFDLTAFRGEYLNYLVGGIVPDISPAAGVLLLALMITASLILPVTAAGFDAALGLLASTLVQQRIYMVLLQFVLVGLRLLVIGALLFGVTQFRVGALEASDMAVWLLLLAFAAIGDWGLSLLYLGYYGAEIWATVPYGVLIGPGLLLFVLAQAALTDAVLALAIYRAENRIE